MVNVVGRSRAAGLEFEREASVRLSRGLEDSESRFHEFGAEGTPGKLHAPVAPDPGPGLPVDADDAWFLKIKKVLTWIWSIAI